MDNTICGILFFSGENESVGEKLLVDWNISLSILISYFKLGSTIDESLASLTLLCLLSLCATDVSLTEAFIQELL